ncbi:MAG: hypothetical protein RLZZ558_1078, partial [Planctomycetota bacterium]
EQGGKSYGDWASEIVGAVEVPGEQ